MKNRRLDEAFSLVEVTLALGIASFCLLTILGLLSVGLSSNAVTIEQTSAVSVISGVAADLRNAPKSTTATKSPRYQIDLPLSAAATLYLTENGVVAASPSAARYQVVISPQTGPSGRMAAWLSIKATWPAPAVQAKAAGSVETFLALNRN